MKKMKVKCLNDGKCFASIAEASRFYNILQKTIQRSCHKLCKTNQRGLYFEFVQQEVELVVCTKSNDIDLYDAQRRKYYDKNPGREAADKAAYLQRISEQS